MCKPVARLDPTYLLIQFIGSDAILLEIVFLLSLSPLIAPNSHFLHRRPKPHKASPKSVNGRHKDFPCPAEFYASVLVRLESWRVLRRY